MISEIQFKHLSKSKQFGYAAGVDFFKSHDHVTFKPGLNILFGPNGCGKSTILRMAALSLAAEQGGVSTITSSWLSEIFDFDAKSKLDGITVAHDGQPIMYGNPRNAVGLFGGGAAFDDDFMSEGLANIQSKASTGYTTMNRLNRMLAVTQGAAQFPAKVDNRLAGSKSAKLTAALALLQGTGPKGAPTLIFDEPESGLAIPAQGNLFSLLYAAARENKFQIIIATHSAFSLGLHGANYIEMQPGYMENSEGAIQTVHYRLEMLKHLRDIQAKKGKGVSASAADELTPPPEKAPRKAPVKKSK